MATEFDDVEALKGMVRVFSPLLTDYLGKLKAKNLAGEWVDSTQPAMYLSYPDELAQSYPHILLTFNGDTNISPVAYKDGLEEVDDPDNPGNLITVQFKKTYLRYIVSITCHAGSNDEVIRATRKSSATILRKLRALLDWQSVKTSINTEMNSSVLSITNIVPSYPLEQTSSHNSSVMSLTFDTVSTSYDYSSGWFDTIEYTGELNRTQEDQDPCTFTKVVGPS